MTLNCFLASSLNETGSLSLREELCCEFNKELFLFLFLFYFLLIVLRGPKMWHEEGNKLRNHCGFIIDKDDQDEVADFNGGVLRRGRWAITMNGILI